MQMAVSHILVSVLTPYSLFALVFENRITAKLLLRIYLIHLQLIDDGGRQEAS